MVAGIIIDKFGALKDKLIDTNIDKQNLCFICGFDQEKLEKSFVGSN
jgi:hypothetical protein